MSEVPESYFPSITRLVTPENAAEMIKEHCHSDDWEDDHVLADEILWKVLESLGHIELVKAWDAVEKWYA
jgi:hypothetical protein